MTLKDELIEALKNEETFFNMEQWVKIGVDQTVPATCQTASCMAGHIEALRPALAKALAPSCLYRDYGVDHALLARKIWETEMKKPCELDFYGYNTELGLEHLTRLDAIDHINGEHDEWPRYDQVDDRLGDDCEE